VRAGYFCVQRNGLLIAYDTATGSELWRRTGLPPGVRCFGNDRNAVVYDRFNRRMTVLGALDAAVVEEWQPEFQEQNLIAVRDATGLVVYRGDDACRIEAVDLVSGGIEWTREFPSGAVAFRAGPDLTGILKLDGQVEFVRWQDGESVAGLSVDVPQPLVHVRCIHDAEQLYLILSGSRNDPGLEAATPGGGIQSNEGHRRLIVNGDCYALDRDSLELQWRTPISNASLLLDQPADVPLLICNELRYPPDRIGQGALVSRVRIIDRRNGELLYDAENPAVHNYFLIERDPGQNWVELRVPGRVVRLDFEPKSQPANELP
jgi:hypothetical protein